MDRQALKDDLKDIFSPSSIIACGAKWGLQEELKASGYSSSSIKDLIEFAKEHFINCSASDRNRIICNYANDLFNKTVPQNPGCTYLVWLYL